MYGIDMGLLWTYLAYMFSAVVVVGLSTGLIAWYSGSRKKAAGNGGKIAGEERAAGTETAGRGGRRHLAHGT